MSALLALLAAAAVTLVLFIGNGSSTTTGSVPKPTAAARSDGGLGETAVAASVGSRPSATPDESNIAASIGGPGMLPGEPDESAVAAAISGR